MPARKDGDRYADHVLLAAIFGYQHSVLTAVMVLRSCSSVWEHEIKNRSRADFSGTAG